MLTVDQVTTRHLDPPVGWAENRGLCPFLGGAVSPSNTMSPGPSPTSVPSGILIHPAFGHNRHGSKIRGGAVPLFWWKQLGLHLTQCGPGRGLPKLPPCQVLSWFIQSFGHSIPTSWTGQGRQDRAVRTDIGSIG